MLYLPIASCQHELNHLHLCEVTFPPKEGLNPWAKCREEVVGIHHYMDDTVDVREESAVSSNVEFGTAPNNLEKIFVCVLNHQSHNRGWT